MSLRSAFWGGPAFSLGDGPGAGEWDRWERRYYQALAVLPYGLLAFPAVVTQLQPYRTLTARLEVLGLVALAAAWVLCLYTLPPPRWRERTGPMLVYFAGLLTLSALLERHSFLFLAFTVTGFFQAFFVLPMALAFIGTAATSSVLYLFEPGAAWSLASAPLLIFIVGLQTITVGGSSFAGTKISEQQGQRRRLLAELQAALDENAGLHVQLLTQAREAGALDERQRLAREIHDTLAQGLTGIVTQLEAAQARPEGWRAHVAQAGSLARESLSEARRALEALRPEPLEGTRLPEAVADLGRRWSATSSVALAFETTGLPVPLLTELEVTLFRVAQEALANVARHASASRVGLTLSYMHDVVHLDVRDDGTGFTPGRPGFGLRAMEQRLRRVGGRLEIESAPGAGTAISAGVPAVARGGGE